MRIWLNGRFVERGEAAVSVLDAGLQHGIGLFETMQARSGRVFRAERHMQRLAASAEELGLSRRLWIEPLVEAVNLAVRENGLDRARVRLTITGGTAHGSERRGTSDPTIIIVAQPPTEYPEVFVERGVRVSIADGRENPLNPMAGHKTLNYWPRIAALQKAGAKGASEAVWFTVSNHLAGGSVSNIFIVKDGQLITPIARGEEQAGALPSCVLPGITRAAIRELAENDGVEVAKKVLDINDLLGADEAFLTNSSWDVLPVAAVEAERIGGGDPGPMTRSLCAALEALIDRETAG